MEKMKALYEKVAGDSKLQAKFTDIMKDSETDSADETKNKLLDFAKEVGYDVDYEEIQAFFNNLSDQQSGELSETELDAVAGGKLNGSEVKHSCMSLGTYCATVSIITAIKGDDCGDRFVC